ncbi:MAG TPA: PEP/pyruvate-binding domain-containing protein [Propionicimonas sp.]|nr:PEP/pyruvate-binding domain-containing protein [Propionicimonas sp.]
MNIRPLTELTSADVQTAGGKGANLGELIRGGFPVPAGFVVTTDAYRDFVRANSLGDALHRRAAQLVKRGAAEPSQAPVSGLFASAEIDPALAAEIVGAYAGLGQDVPVAVRSSATAEDLPEASFAGQQDTYLNVVGADALLAAVRDCWASLWTDRAIWYRNQVGADASEVALAVVVQVMVPADAAGVLFTANPANGRSEETVITAAWGLGEAVVSGLVDTDTIVVDPAAGRVLSTQVADKAVRIDSAPGARGTRTLDNPDDQRRAPVLTAADALRLARLGRDIEAHFGAPVDIEWTLTEGTFQIVQSRPITALADRVGEVPTDWPVPAKGLYFRASITEQLPEPLSPLFADLMATAVPAGLNRMLAELSPGERYEIGFPTINGYAFYRYTMAAMGGMLKQSPELLRMVTAAGGAQIEERWRDRLAHYTQRVAELGGADLAALPAADLLSRIAGLVDEVAYYYTAVQTVIPLASMAELTWTGAYAKLVRRPGDPAAEEFLLGFDSEPIRAERSLYAVASWVRTEPSLAAALAVSKLDALADAVPNGVAPQVWTQWRERFGAHLAAHGHTLYNLDFVNPVPADAPEPVLQALRFFLTDAAVDPTVRQTRLAARREDISAALFTRLSGRRQRLARGLLAWAQQTGPLREDALSAMGLYLPAARRLLREFGGRLVAAGALADPLDACWLTLADARSSAARLDASAAVEDLRRSVSERKTVARGQALAHPPQYLPKNAAMDSFGWMYPAKEGQSGSVLVGNAGSGGVVTARARVLAGPADFASFEPGEVLVASITTPAYTPLFAMASGVVTDIGGVLSHGSIVAREYGIPAVLGTGSATRLIRTGDEITVDGAAGRVLLPGAEPDSLAKPDPKRWLVPAAVAALVAATVAHFWYHARKRSA